MLNSALSVANRILELAWNEGESISPLKLQKLIYYAHGWNLAIQGERLIDEHIEGWKYGPVVPSVYHEFKQYGNNPITSKAFEVKKGEASTPTLDDGLDKEVVDRIWKMYHGFSAEQLANMTHKTGTPWKNTYTGEYVSEDIDDNLIKEHFKKNLDSPNQA